MTHALTSRTARLLVAVTLLFAAVAVVVSTGVAWSTVRSFESDIYHVSSAALGEGGEVVSRRTSAEDVTEEVVDVESRLKSQRASVARQRERGAGVGSCDGQGLAHRSILRAAQPSRRSAPCGRWCRFRA